MKKVQYEIGRTITKTHALMGAQRDRALDPLALSFSLGPPTKGLIDDLCQVAPHAFRSGSTVDTVQNYIITVVMDCKNNNN